MLMSLIVCLAQRMRLTRRNTQEFLRDWLGVEISTSTINQCIHEAGRAVEPIEEQLVDELQQATLAYVDETPWKEWGKLLWLWVISTSTLCLYFIGYRSKEILLNVFEERFVGWLMSDGYHVYRRFQTAPALLGPSAAQSTRAETKPKRLKPVPLAKRLTACSATLSRRCTKPAKAP